MIDPEWWPLALAALAVLAGAVAVRTTGMGFALLSSPFLVMALGPFEGILVTNVCGIVAALLNLTAVHTDLDWKRAASVIPAGIVGRSPALALAASGGARDCGSACWGLPPVRGHGGVYAASASLAV